MSASCLECGSPMTGVEPCCRMIAVPLVKWGGGLGGFAFIDADDLALVAWHRWNLGANGYATSASGAVYMHRVLLGLTDPRRYADHVNHNRLDNRRANLREVSPTENAHNKAPGGRGDGRFRGVYQVASSSRWYARAYFNRKAIHLGSFDTELEAGLAVEAFRREHMPLAPPDGPLERLAECHGDSPRAAA